MALRFLWENLLDSATLTESSQTVGNAAENVQNDSLGKVWSTSDDAAAETLVIDLGSAQAVQAFAAIDHSLTASDSLIKIQGNASDSWGGPSVNETVTYTADKLVYYFSAAETYRYWRFIFTKSSASEKRRFGRLFLGPYYQSPRHADARAFTITPVDLSVTERAIGGTSWSDQRPLLEQVRAEFTSIDQEVYDELKSIADSLGTHTPLIVAADPTYRATEWLWYGKMSELRDRTHMYWDGVGGDRRWDLAFEITEEK